MSFTVAGSDRTLTYTAYAAKSQASRRQLTRGSPSRRPLRGFLRRSPLEPRLSDEKTPVSATSLTSCNRSATARDFFYGDVHAHACATVSWLATLAPSPMYVWRTPHRYSRIGVSFARYPDVMRDQRVRERRRAGRPPAGAKQGEKVKDYPQLSIRVPVEFKARLNALSAVTGLAQWRVIVEAINCLFHDLPPHDRELVAGLSERLKRAG